MSLQRRRRAAAAAPAAAPPATASSPSWARSAVPRRRPSRSRSPGSRTSPASTSSTPRTPTSPPRIVQRVGAGDAPDIGLFPQPGGLLDLSDDMTPLADVIDLPAIEESLIPGFLEAATKDGNVYGAPMRMAVKSIVWYPKPSYEDAGYSTEPATFQELIAESEKIAGRRHPAVVHGLGVRPGHRLGRHRLARGDGAAHRGARRLRPVGQPRDPVQRPADRRGARRVR